MPVEPPIHKSEQTGNAVLDRIQNNVRMIVEYLRETFWLTKRACTQLALDVSTSSTAYVDLMECTLLTSQASGSLVVSFDASVGVTVSDHVTYFQFLVNGVPTKGFYDTMHQNYVYSAGFRYRIPVTKGPQRVVAQWKVSAGTSRILASTSVNEYASLHLSEEV